MTKIDLKKELKHLYRPSAKKISVVEVPPMQFLMIDGQGDPNTARAYTEAVEALYAVAYKIKFASKKHLQKDFTVMPLEGLWWAEDMSTFDAQNKASWLWTAMIMQPDWIDADMVERAKEVAAQKKELPALPKMRFETLAEGLAVQILYTGPYADEAPTIARLHTFIHENGYQRVGKHHEIYLSDPRRVAPEKLKTVIRQPVSRLPA